MDDDVGAIEESKNTSSPNMTGIEADNDLFTHLTYLS